MMTASAMGYEVRGQAHPINKTKSVILTEEGLRESKRLFQQHFVTAG